MNSKSSYLLRPQKATEEPNSSPLCIICAGEPSPNLVRDSNFVKMVQFYIKGLVVDVKPAEYSKYELCAPCHESLVEFYDTNECVDLMENHLRKMQKNLIRRAVEGAHRRQKIGSTTHSIDAQVVAKWGNTPECPRESDAEAGSEVTTTLVNRKPSKQGSPKRAKLSDREQSIFSDSNSTEIRSTSLRDRANKKPRF